MKVQYEFVVQPDYNGTPPDHVRFTVEHWNFKPGEKLYLDDFAL